MAWTKEKAEEVAAEQTAELMERGAFDMKFTVRDYGEWGWGAEGEYSIDGETDPIWAPVVAALKPDPGPE